MFAGKTVDAPSVSEILHPKHDRYYLKDLLVRAESGLLSVHRGRIESDGEIYVHTHEVESETFYIISGQVECTLGEEKVPFSAGSCGFAPPGVPHGLKNTGKIPVELLAIFTPPLK